MYSYKNIAIACLTLALTACGGSSDEEKSTILTDIKSETVLASGGSTESKQPALTDGGTLVAGDVLI